MDAFMRNMVVQQQRKDLPKLPYPSTMRIDCSIRDLWMRGLDPEGGPPTRHPLTRQVHWSDQVNYYDQVYIRPRAIIHNAIVFESDSEELVDSESEEEKDYFGSGVDSEC
jgi:hypothetical protein